MTTKKTSWEVHRKKMQKKRERIAWLKELCNEFPNASKDKVLECFIKGKKTLEGGRLELKAWDKDPDAYEASIRRKEEEILHDKQLKEEEEEKMKKEKAMDKILNLLGTRALGNEDFIKSLLGEFENDSSTVYVIVTSLINVMKKDDQYKGMSLKETYNEIATDVNNQKIQEWKKKQEASLSKIKATYQTMDEDLTINEYKMTIDDEVLSLSKSVLMTKEQMIYLSRFNNAKQILALCEIMMDTPGLLMKCVLKKELIEAFFRKYSQLKSDSHMKIAFHGTRTHNAESIEKNGLKVPDGINVHHEHDNGWWGKGIYLSSNPRTAMMYAYGGVLFICAILQGRIFKLKHRRNGGSLEPGYHSHYNPNEEEIILFDNDQVVPLFSVYESQLKRDTFYSYIFRQISAHGVETDTPKIVTKKLSADEKRRSKLASFKAPTTLTYINRKNYDEYN